MIVPSGLWNLPTRNGKMPHMNRFDREFFGISESDVTFMDPQERLLLESTYEAIVDAGETKSSSLRSSFCSVYNHFESLSIRIISEANSSFIFFSDQTMQTTTQCRPKS